MINSINFTYLIKRRKITVNLNRIEKIKKKKKLFLINLFKTDQSGYNKCLLPFTLYL